MGSAIESMGGVAKNKQQLINILYAFITGRQAEKAEQHLMEKD